MLLLVRNGVATAGWLLVFVRRHVLMGCCLPNFINKQQQNAIRRDSRS